MNVTTEELKAVQELKKEQEQGVIRLSAIDKGGGIAVMDTQQTKWFCNIWTLSTRMKTEWNIKQVLDEGVQAKFISKADQKVMEPNDKPACLYGLPKLH